VVGCPIPECVVLPELNELNPDRLNPKFNSSKHGCYKPNCGIDNLRYAYGHDEYMYRMLLHNRCKIPK
jgi:inositol oxygenase